MCQALVVSVAAASNAFAITADSVIFPTSGLFMASGLEFSRSGCALLHFLGVFEGAAGQPREGLDHAPSEGKVRILDGVGEVHEVFFLRVVPDAVPEGCDQAQLLRGYGMVLLEKAEDVVQGPPVSGFGAFLDGAHVVGFHSCSFLACSFLACSFWSGRHRRRPHTAGVFGLAGGSRCVLPLGVEESP